METLWKKEVVSKHINYSLLNCCVTTKGKVSQLTLPTVPQLTLPTVPIKLHGRPQKKFLIFFLFLVGLFGKALNSEAGGLGAAQLLEPRAQESLYCAKGVSEAFHFVLGDFRVFS